MSVDYMALAEKLGTKLNTIGEAAYKIGVAGVKLEEIGLFTSLTLASVITGVITYRIYKKLNIRDNGWTHDQEGFFTFLSVILGLISFCTIGASLVRLPYLMVAIYNPDYLLIKQLLQAVK